MSQLQVTGEAKIRDIQGPVVANSGVITALDGAASQYVRGDGTLADFPTSTGGGSSVSYYLNGSVNQGTFGGSTYYEMSKTPIIGAGTDFPVSTNGLVSQFITDANDPDLLEVPGGNFNVEFYFSVSNNTGNPTVYAELYKYDGTTFTLLGSSQAVPESINQGTTIAPYYFAIPVGTAALALTDRIAIRIYANVDGRTVTLHTENSHLCQVVTTFSKGMVSLNNLTDQSQFITTGTSGTNFNIVSSGDTHTFNLPTASATNTGKLSSTDWSTFNNKLSTTTAAATYVPYTGATSNVDLGLFGLTSNAVKAIGDNSTYGGVISIKQNNVIGGLIGTGYTELFGKTNRLGISFGAGSIAYLSNSVLTAERTYTLPDASGTLALTSNLSSYVPYTGATTNVDLGTRDLTSRFIYLNGIGTTGGNLFLRKDVDPAFTLNYTTLYSTDNNIGFGSTDGTNTKKAIFSFDLLTNNTLRTFTLPDASGTIALTSNLSSYVPYTGATANVDLGIRALFAQNIVVGQTSTQGYIHFKTGGSTAISADTCQAPYGTNGMIYSFDQTGGNYKQFVIDSSSLTNNTIRTYTMPNASGTLALTSDLSAYLPLTGGTLTGGLSGTTATFSGLGTFYQLTMTGATAGRIFYAQTGGVVSQSGNLNWNETNGMLGVGTPNPSAVITAFSNNAATQFKAAGTAPAFTFSNTLTSASLACVFGLATSANHFVTGTAAGDMAIANQSTTAGAIVFGTGTAEKMRMSPSGRFLIGTSVDSGALFQVAGAATFSNNLAVGGSTDDTSGGLYSNIALNGTTYSRYSLLTGGTARARFQFDGTNTSITTTSTGGKLQLATAAATSMEFITNDSLKMIITSGGNVGIGTSSPSANLHISGYTSGLPATSGSAQRGGFRIANSSNIAFDFGTVAAGQAWLQVSDANNYASNFALLLNPNGGNVGIGTSSPSQRLSVSAASTGYVFLSENSRNVSGDLNTLINLGNNANNTSSYFVVCSMASGDKMYVYGNGNIVNTNNSYGTLSDATLKENIVDATPKLDSLLKLKVKNFNLIGDETKQIGFIAQEFEEVFPSMIDLDGKSGKKAIKTSVLTPMLVKGLQELKAEKDAEILELRNQIEELKALINK